MRYQNFTVTIGEFQGSGYPMSAVGDRVGRVSTVLPPPAAELKALLSQIGLPGRSDGGESAARLAGAALFRWAFAGPVEPHLRVAWDRCLAGDGGLRIRLSADAPEISAWPWELLYDPERDHTFATSPATLLVRYYDQADRFGALVEQEAELPLNVLLVLPAAADLELDVERRTVEAVAAALPNVLRLRALQGVVTRSDLADALLTSEFDVVHFSGHGAFIDGRGYVGLNRPDGEPDWIHSGALSRLAVNHKSIKLVVLNVCSSGRVDDGRAFQGLAPQMVRYGVPAVVAMQFPISNTAATTFSEAFYKRLCNGRGPGHVDVAVTYARGVLAALDGEEASWASPVLYTHAADGRIYRAPRRAARNETAVPVAPTMSSLRDSLQVSRELDDDWDQADPSQLVAWRQALRQAAEAYRGHIKGVDPDAQRLAEEALRLVQVRLATIEQALARA